VQRIRTLIVCTSLLFTLSGTARGELWPERSSIDFGDVGIAVERWDALGFHNFGDVDITITEIGIKGGPFWFEAGDSHGPCVVGGVLSPGGACALEFTFGPTRPGHYVAFIFITITTEDSHATQVISVRLEGDGIK
jgi:hypothetical protein